MAEEVVEAAAKRAEVVMMMLAVSWAVGLREDRIDSYRTPGPSP